MGQGKALLGGRSEQSIAYIHTLMIHILVQTDTNIQHNLTHPPQQNAGLPFPFLSLLTAHCFLRSGAQQSLMRTDTSNSGRMVHDK